MNPELFKTLVALLPAALIFVGAVALFLREKTLGPFFQLCGAFCIVLVVLAHMCEALRLLPSMGWGSEHSAGHYMDLTAAVIGLTLFPLGYLLHALFPATGREDEIRGK